MSVLVWRSCGTLCGCVLWQQCALFTQDGTSRRCTFFLPIVRFFFSRDWKLVKAQVFEKRPREQYLFVIFCPAQSAGSIINYMRCPQLSGDDTKLVRHVQNNGRSVISFCITGFTQEDDGRILLFRVILESMFCH